jgi:hypothetical protein
MSNNNSRAAIFAAISAILLLLLVSFSSLPFVTTTMAQQIPLTQEELDQQNRLQSVIANTTKNLENGQKQVDGIVYTPRWSNPVWVEPDSLSILFVYCLPGEFADSGQEILGGSDLEVLESYSLAVTNNLTGWLMIVENEDTQNRFPAAVGVICTSDVNDVQTRVLSPEEQQEINNIIQQFITIQNTQVTNIDQVINIINNVTSTPPAQNQTGGGTPSPTTGQPLKAEIIPNATTLFDAAFVKLDADVTGGTPPYNYHWRWVDPYLEPLLEGSNRSFIPFIQVLGTHTFILDVTDSKNQTASDTIQIDVREQPLTVKIIPNATSGFTLDRFELKTNVTGGAEPYIYSWNFLGDFQDFAVACNVLDDPTAVPDYSCIVFDTDQAGTHEVIGYVTDSKAQIASDTVQITVEERAPTNDTGTTTEQPLKAEINANATVGFAPATIEFDSSVTGGTPPYIYNLTQVGSGRLNFYENFITQLGPGTHTFILDVTDSNGQTASDTVQITVREGAPPEGGGVLLPPETGEEGQPLGGGLLPLIPPPPPNDNGEVVSPPEGGGGREGGESPPETGEEGGGTPPPPPPDDTGEEEEVGGESPLPDEEPTTPPGG